MLTIQTMPVNNMDTRISENQNGFMTIMTEYDIACPEPKGTKDAWSDEAFEQWRGT